MADDRPVTYELFLSLPSPDDRQRTEQAITRIIDAGGDFDLSFHLHGNNGRSQWIRLRANLISDDGAPRHLRGIVLDINDAKQIEAELRKRESHLRSILDTVPDAMIVIDGHGIIQSFSAAAERYVRLFRAGCDRSQRQRS